MLDTKIMEAGDLFFKAIETIYDSWGTVIKYEVIHYNDKNIILAGVLKKTTDRKDNKYFVVIDNVTCEVDSLKEVLDYIIDYYE